MKIVDSKYRVSSILLLGCGILTAYFTFVFFGSDSTSPEPNPGLVAEPNAGELLPARRQREPDRPVAKPAGDYVGSEGCRECHANEHRSWHASYHRTMTQVVSTADRLFGDFNNVTVTNHAVGQIYRLDNQNGLRLFFTDNHRDLLASNRKGHVFPVVMTTGSHHMQAYWFASGQGQTLGMVPFVYLREDERWVPSDATFLKEPFAHDSLEPGRWNYACINCHTTPDRFTKDSVNGLESRVTEFGISCEACHGPAKRHIEFQRASAGNPNSSQADRAGADPIVNPKTLSPSLSSQVCGSCHGVLASLKATSPDVRTGFQPGTELSSHVYVVTGTPESVEHQRRSYPALSREIIEADMRNRFWPDGQVRVTGREYNGLLETPCHQRGTLSCLSCHTMHPSLRDTGSLEEWADDQLKEGMRTDAACTQCHEAGKFADIKHTHHQSESTGSQCLNCHMPHTTYGLLKAIRSHTIDSPSALKSYETGRPNACNLCHLDRSLAWTAQHLTDWFGQPMHKVEGDWQDVSAAVMWTLTGDAAQRALVAWHYNWEPARAVSGTNWFAPYLVILADDDYDAVRYIAARALRCLPEYADMNFDFVGPVARRRKVVAELMARWFVRENSQKNVPDGVLMDAHGKLRGGELQRLLKNRNSRPVSLVE